MVEMVAYLGDDFGLDVIDAAKLAASGLWIGSLNNMTHAFESQCMASVTVTVLSVFANSGQQLQPITP